MTRGTSKSKLGGFSGHHEAAFGGISTGHRITIRRATLPAWAPKAEKLSLESHGLWFKYHNLFFMNGYNLKGTCEL
jgi:hypothetical protein